MPEHVPNGGLYGGPHSTAWYIPQQHHQQQPILHKCY